MSQSPEQVLVHEPLPAQPQYRANIIFLSYRFSQGGIGTQNRLLLRVEEDRIPNLFADKELEETKERVQKMVGPYFLNQALHPATAVPWDYDLPESFIKSEELVTNELAGLFARFKDRESLVTFDHSLAAIAQSVITMDSDYLSRSGGRGGDSEDLMIEVSEYSRDPYDSLFMKYGVLNASTSNSEYDQIFHSLATKEIIGQLDPHSLKQLRIIIEVHLRQHPGMESNERIVNLKNFCEGLANGKQ